MERNSRTAREPPGGTERERQNMGIRIALAGNPNCGKTTMFNDLTGATQYVGNWPGVTVEKKEGTYAHALDVTITDLPGVYSLSPYSPEEIVTRDYLLGDAAAAGGKGSGRPDAVINLVDATNLERNLYLTTQILDLGLPVVVALNMMDLVEKNGDKIDVAKLSGQAGLPRGGDVGAQGPRQGRAAGGRHRRGGGSRQPGRARACASGEPPRRRCSSSRTSNAPGATRGKSSVARWHAVKLLEREQRRRSTGWASPAARPTPPTLEAIREAPLRSSLDDDAESPSSPDARYHVHRRRGVRGLRQEVAQGRPLTASDKIDRVVTNRILGIPILHRHHVRLCTTSRCPPWAPSLTDWANDGVFGDGWLYTGTEQYDGRRRAQCEESMAAAEAAEGGRGRARPRGPKRSPTRPTYGLYHPGPARPWPPAAGWSPSAPRPGCTSARRWTASSPAWAP